MKNLSLFLNAILLIAVSFLFYKQYSKKNTAEIEISGKETNTPLAPILPIASIASLPKNMPLVFINIDSLYMHYEFAKKEKAASEIKIANYQRSYQAKTEAFQKAYEDYVAKAGAGKYTKEQGMEIEAGLQKEKSDIMYMEQNQEKMMSEFEKATVDVQKAVFEYLTRFNKEHGYYCALGYTRLGGNVLGINESLDVTNTVLEGLNTEYKSKSTN